MKTTLITAAVLLSAPALAQPTAATTDSTGPTPEQVAAAKALLTAKADTTQPIEITPEMEPYMPAIKESARIITEITTTLKGVKDKASADAAAPQITAAISKMKELEQANKDLPQPNRELQVKLQPVIMQYMAEPVQQFTLSVMTIAASQAYGSEALMKALESLSNAQ